jgi:hypothetical protein
MIKYLIENTNVNLMHIDKQGRSALDYAQTSRKLIVDGGWPYGKANDLYQLFAQHGLKTPSLIGKYF